MTRSLSTRTLALLAALAASLALVAPANSGAAAAPTDLGHNVQVVVRAAASLTQVTEAVTRLGGTVVERFGRFDMVTARVPASSVAELSATSGVTSVTEDYSYAPKTRRGSNELGEPSRTAAATIGADEAWAAGYTGEGVGIAVVDTGIDPRPGLSDNIVATVDVSGEASKKDGYGHGTFMSGAIVGNERGVDGIAPDAELVGIKVADRNGATSLSAVLRGISAAIDARDALGVRVVLLAFGRPVEADNDPLQFAVEQAWAEGLVVVVAAGNEGPHAGSLTTPGASPYVLTVGAVDDAGTADHADDTVPTWTAQGPSGRRAAPDLIAPGVSLVSTRVPGSGIDRDNPQAHVDGQTFRGSGSSIAAAVTAGAAALVIDAHPDLTPDEVKGRLLAAADAAPAGSAVAAVGQGVVDVDGAIAESAAAANGDLPAIKVEEREADGDEYPFWKGHHWGGHHWGGHHWGGHHWGGATWSGHHWGGHHWGGHHWGGHHWGSASWMGAHWL